ncbi:hypothetical protein KSP35_19220 [Aquihabitans sp. G128]|uniref:hypothetical protein n=1 Tax=Aquihabitans sp. G128 TaxID=2849779 RepID=UPI001C23924B|nr:hypothetical protein [Aquihabitans sp. G128]QXC60433.1 hypothetical protein KSP35_19220 [Aquihabitans sp. G128]
MDDPAPGPTLPPPPAPPQPVPPAGSELRGGPADVLRVASAVVALAALALYLWAVSVPPVTVGPDRSRIASLANPGQVVTLLAPILLLGALAGTAALGRGWRAVVGAALAYFPATAWAVGPTVLWEYPEPLRAVDGYRWFGWALVLACVATALGALALAAAGIGRPAEPSAGAGAPAVGRPGPAVIERVAAGVGTAVLVLTWFLSREVIVEPDRRVDQGAVLYRHWPAIGDGMGRVASVLGALLTLAVLVGGLALAGRQPGGRVRAQLWLGAAVGLVLDLAARALSFGNLVRPEVYRDQPPAFPDPPTTAVYPLGILLVVLAAVALAVAAWSAAQVPTARAGPPDATG